ncbi:ATP-binding protein [Henriciella marina]|uniref:ATP-binding protein n=1 Tax=Henriciella marina TaxID=453851 RepID=A0ABT4LU61_9PROT|nr:ATP-binding protein [Henriciella marina]MCZ4297662.1 ATP-binding protein [Henriciella marina]
MVKKQLRVDTSPDKQFLIDTFSRDASAIDCIFDLLDNSIDAGSAHLRFLGAKPDQEGLLKTYDPIEIKLFVSARGVKIVDNSGGMTSADLENSILKFGHRSAQPFSIGMYGVGLNRAIFKLGEHTTISTHTGTERSHVSLDMTSYRSDDDEWLIEGETESSKSQASTTIKITNPPASIVRHLSDTSFTDRLSTEASIRYCRFLERGLSLNINKNGIQPRSVVVRENGPFKPLTKDFQMPSGVRVSIVAGQHEEHRFKREPDYDKAINTALGSEYGWSVSCNGRVVVRADRSPKTGWDQNWHNEFNGFVGSVSFSAENGQLLPWNSPKNDVVVSDDTYQQVLEDMRQFTRNWRSFISSMKRQPKNSTIHPPPAKPKAPKKPPVKPKRRTSQKSITKPIGYRTVLPVDINEIYCSDKLLDLVHEAKRHDLYDCRYSGLALIRMLFEIGAAVFFIRHKLYQTMIDGCIKIEESSRGAPLSSKKKKDFYPSLSVLIDYLSQNYSDWDLGQAKMLKPSLDKFKHHKSDLNSAIHHPITTISTHKAISIRDEVMPVLRHFIEQ